MPRASVPSLSVSSRVASWSGSRAAGPSWRHRMVGTRPSHRPHRPRAHRTRPRADGGTAARAVPHDRRPPRRRPAATADRVHQHADARARQTAAIAMPEAEADEAHQLVEVDYGDYEGLTATRSASETLRGTCSYRAVPGGESWLQFGTLRLVHRQDGAHGGRPHRGGVHPWTLQSHPDGAHARPAGHPGSAFYNDTATVAVLDHRRGELRCSPAGTSPGD